MTEEEASPIFHRGDVVYGDDPFKGDEDARPWLILSNHEGRPFHGEQYIAVTLTTKSWMDGLIDIPEESWLRGGTPAESRIVPWGVQSIDHEDIDFWQGRLETNLVDEAVAALAEELR
ncbi:type II toxin-antitoxin system PemK/MazF family toxin (plasmid) [Haloarcula sp. NS06]|uniref:Type II toxin-antitoxin system PemK/MazF family toxin n=1 Tax=Haloarcula terrestris TaxID=2950533 RepID=A0AAE4F0Y1_9EURY|nr:type II toxin-antitoxin system PemK/MazF family toxin [Haloarcula terrestris]MDS0222478.1 type II toxin-antitoxin system PemK/MazF family toxin [Haloarcula terrestris]